MKIQRGTWLLYLLCLFFLKNTYDDNDRGVDNVDKWWMGADCEGDVLVDKWMKTC